MLMVSTELISYHHILYVIYIFDVLKSTTTWDVKYSTLLVEIKYTKKSVTLDILCYLPDVLIADALLFTTMQ